MKQYLITVRKRQLQLHGGGGEEVGKKRVSSSDKRAVSVSSVSTTSGNRERSGSSCSSGSDGDGVGLSMVEKLQRRSAKSGHKSNLGIIKQTEKDYCDIVTNAAKVG